jgi:hypothetical protein
VEVQMSESKDTVNNVNKADSSSNNDTTTTNDNNNNIEDAEAKRLEEERAARRKNAQDKLETSKKEMEAAKASDSEAASKIAADLGLEVAGGFQKTQAELQKAEIRRIQQKNKEALKRFRQMVKNEPTTMWRENKNVSTW